MLVGPLSFVFVWGNQIKIVVKWLIPILISHFSRTHSVSRSPSKLHWNLFERFFLDVHLAFTCAPASVHLTRKNAYAVVEIEDRNGSLSLTQSVSRETHLLPPRLSPGPSLSLLFRMECDLREHCSFPSLSPYLSSTCPFFIRKFA